MQELKSIKKLPHRSHYYGAVFKNSIVAIFILLFSLAIGILGYSYFFQLGFEDSLLNASMILAGMGPVDVAKTSGAKIFASFYALYSGVAFLSSVAVLFSPILHRFLHRFHLDVRE
jgi:hypothetical protein